LLGVRSQKLIFVDVEETDRKSEGSYHASVSKFTIISQWNSQSNCSKADKGPVIMPWCPFDPGKVAVPTTPGTIN